MDTISTIFSYIFSFKLWIILCFLSFIFVLTGGINSYLQIKQKELNMSKEYDEKSIINHLDYIILEALNYYNIMNIASTNTFYITDKMQQDLLDYLSKTIPERMSNDLLEKLMLIYKPSYINTFLAEHIYLTVVSFVLDFNMNRPKTNI